MGRGLLTYIFIPLFYGALGWAMAAGAGRHLPFVWATLGVQATLSLISLHWLDDSMLKERLHPPKGQDKDPLGRFVLSVLFVAHYYLTVEDLGHWHISDNVPVVLQVIALILVALGWAGLYWSMATNKFFSSAIRLQSDRGQIVINTGPYHWIRHPGYAFASLGFLFEGVAFGSWISVLPTIAIAGYLAYRTVLEEKLLTNDLPGYKEYADQVRFRWVPGIW
jgi:protein-S-isoprenylcysteine O-methyltransferase Ste14